MSESGGFYKWWPLLDSLPDGWKIDKTAGSPLHGYEFCTNGKSAISGQQKRALVRVKYGARVETEPEQRPAQPKEAPREPAQKQDEPYRKTLNNLARNKMKVKLLADIRTDLMICEIEGWNKREYISEIQTLINDIGKKQVQQSLELTF